MLTHILINLISLGVSLADIANTVFRTHMNNIPIVHLLMSNAHTLLILLTRSKCI